jgi:2-C-methyl-D-erythritol 4-phosphate cytidylyltransferase
METIAIILAGGKGERLRSLCEDKVLLPLCGVPVIAWSVSAFAQSGWVDRLVLVYRDEAQRDAIAAVIEGRVPASCRVQYVQGGLRRQDSVRHALEVLEGRQGWVLVHDAARPFVTAGDVQRLLDAARNCGASALGRPVSDTIKLAANTGEVLKGLVLEDLPRARLHAMETPQVFDCKALLDAYREVESLALEVTDCIGAYGRGGAVVALVGSEQHNLKITHPRDVELADFLVGKGSIKKVFELPAP